MKENSRSNFIDIIKGIAAILVVVGHAIENGLGENYSTPQIFYNNWIHIFIYSFHMPLFMLISGYLFSFSLSRRSFGNSLHDRVQKLIVPNLAWCITIIVFSSLMEYVRSGQISALGDNSLLYNVCYSILHLYWFLWALFASSLIVLLVNKYFKDRLLVYVVIFILLLFIPERFQEHIFMYPYFVVAYVMGKNNIFSRIKRCRKGWLIVLACIMSVSFLWMLNYYEYNDYIYITGVSLSDAGSQGYTILQKIGIDTFRWGIGFLGSAAIVLVIYILSISTKLKLKLNSLIACGRYSLVIYCSNPIAIALVVPIILRMIQVDDSNSMLLIGSSGITVGENHPHAQ